MPPALTNIRYSESTEKRTTEVAHPMEMHASWSVVALYVMKEANCVARRHDLNGIEMKRVEPRERSAAVLFVNLREESERVMSEVSVSVEKSR